jgi:phospholipid transport system substrate-binding protein
MTASRPLWIGVALAAALVWTVAGMARAAPDDFSGQAGRAAAFIQSLGAELLAIQAEAGDSAAAAQSAALEGLIRRGFDLDLTSQLVLGKYWNRASQVQRRAFKEHFAQYLVHSYSRHLKAYRVETLEIVSSSPVAKSDFLVETRVEGAQEHDPANPVWRLRRRDSGFKIIDVHVDGISLALTERSQFGSVIRQNGLDGMLSALAKRVAASTELAANDSALELHPASLFTSPNVSKIDLLLRQR